MPSALVDRYAACLEREQIDIAGIEFIEDAEARAWTYDSNGTTNYAPEFEEEHALSGMAAVADLLKRELDAQTALLSLSPGR